MFASVTLRFQTEAGVGKQDFWRSFEQNRDQKPLSEADSFSPERANQYERQFREEFARKLERHINEEIDRAEAEGSDLLRPRKGYIRISGIKVRLVTVHYGSIKAILDIIGVDNSDLRDFVLMALEIYSPLAFQEAFDTQVDVRAQAEFLGGTPPMPPGNTGGMAGLLNPIFVRSVTSILIPVAVALVICFIVFDALMRELDAVHREAAGVRTERIEIVKALVDQNKSISTSLVEYTKGSTASARAMEDLLASLVKRLVERPLAPAGDYASLVSSVDKMKSEIGVHHRHRNHRHLLCRQTANKD
jgi:hypothetical protein